MYHKREYFETIKCNDFEVYNLNYHKQRIATTIGKNISLDEYIYPPSNKLLKCKVIYNKYEIIDIIYDSYTAKNINSFKLIHDDNIIYNKKSTNRSVIDNLYLQKKLSDEIIIIKNNLITDTSIANIAIYYNGTWYTPKTPLLFGTTRQRYIDNGSLFEKDITIDILQSSSKIALLNAMIDFKIIHNCDIIL